jgi:ubiquinone/menaquinone biosynthesis C-methylase UbiE
MMYLNNRDDMMDPSEIKKRESQAWGKADFDEIERASAKSGHIIGALLQKRSIQNFDLRDKHVINVGGGYGEEAEFLLKTGAAMVALVDIAPAQLRHSRVRKQKHHLDGLECIRGDAEEEMPRIFLSKMIRLIWGTFTWHYTISRAM